MMIDHRKLAVISKSSYIGEQALINLGFSDVCVHRHNNIIAYVCLEKSSRQAVLVFRGSDDWKDWKMNLDFLKVKSPLNRDVHGGFLAAYKKVSEGIVRQLDKLVGWDIHLTGHSLGAALAVICAVHSGVKFRSVVTFGQPRVFGSNNPVNLSRFNVVRYVNRSDVVCRIPTVGYCHSGDLHFICDSGIIEVNPSGSFMWLDSHWKLTNWLSDHSIINYVKALDTTSTLTYSN